MYKNELENAIPVTWKANVRYCPPDCGGEEFDEFEYAPYCPNEDCGKYLALVSYADYCPYCGTKIWSYCKPPIINIKRKQTKE